MRRGRSPRTARNRHGFRLAATENDPALFTRYLISALRRAGDLIGERAEAMLQIPGANPTAWMRSLVNDLAVVQAPITLVLDDYHVVTEPACHALVQFILDHAPLSLHLIVCTRADPPIALGSLRAIGQLAEIRSEDLRFTDGEAAALLVETEGLKLEYAGGQVPRCAHRRVGRRLVSGGAVVARTRWSGGRRGAVRR